MSFFEVLMVIFKFAGAVGVFIYGVKHMSEGLQKVAGDKMRSILGRITGSPISGILTGAGVTAAIQSSTATTVMVVSFVNSGLLTLAGAIAVVMGANIGTTLTSWIILLGMGGSGGEGGAFLFPLVVIALSLPFMMMKGEKCKYISEFIIGFGLLLIGLQFLQDAMPTLSDDFLAKMATWSDWGFWSILIFIIIGAILTVLIQASSAVMAITLVMCANGWIGFDIAVAIVMGQNIGTTLTANIAAMVANATGKKAARAHFVFNVVGVILTLIVFHPLMNLIASMTESMSGINPYDAAKAAESLPLAITIFHTFFNVANTIILAFFIPQIIRIVDWMVKTPAEDAEDEYRLKFISGGYMNTAELNLQLAQKEIENFSKRVLRMYTFLPSLRTAKDEEEFTGIFDRIEKYEGITDRMEVEIAQFLTKISEGDMSREASQRVSSMLRIIDNLESIGDDIYQIAIHRKNKREEEVHFDDGLNQNIAHITDLVQHALDVMDANLHTDYNHIDLDSAYKAEDDVNKYRDVLRAQHLDALKNGTYSYSIGTAYSGIYALYEKLADHAINISEAIDNSAKIDYIQQPSATPLPSHN